MCVVNPSSAAQLTAEAYVFNVRADEALAGKIVGDRGRVIDLEPREGSGNHRDQLSARRHLDLPHLQRGTRPIGEGVGEAISVRCAQHRPGGPIDGHGNTSYRHPPGHVQPAAGSLP